MRAVHLIIALIVAQAAIPGPSHAGRPLAGPPAAANPAEAPPPSLEGPSPGTALPAPPKEPADTTRAVLQSSALLVALYGLLLLSQPDEWPDKITASGDRFARAWTEPPTWNDAKQWKSNYIGHPFMGAYLFLIARRTGHSFFSSFLFSTANSVVWEYLFESWYEQPSAPDLLITSTTGSLIGEGFWQVRQWLLKDGVSGVGEYLLLMVVDPFTCVDLLLN